jgi:hypothetical protein
VLKGLDVGEKVITVGGVGLEDGGKISISDQSKDADDKAKEPDEK